MKTKNGVPGLATASLPLKIGQTTQKERKIVFQPSILRGELLVSGRVIGIVPWPCLFEKKTRKKILVPFLELNWTLIYILINLYLFCSRRGVQAGGSCQSHKNYVEVQSAGWLSFDIMIDDVRSASKGKLQWRKVVVEKTPLQGGCTSKVQSQSLYIGVLYVIMSYILPETNMFAPEQWFLED